MSNASDNQLTRRPATNADLDLIYSILRAALGPYVEQAFGPWDEPAQRKHFDEVTRAEDHSILELDGQPAGCLCFKQFETEFYLARLFILPPFQNRGLGTRVLREILDTVDTHHKPIRLRVLRVNPARRLYERHGFSVIEESETHYTMLRPASQRPDKSDRDGA